MYFFVNVIYMWDEINIKVVSMLLNLKLIFFYCIVNFKNKNFVFWKIKVLGIRVFWNKIE